jgi:hypothetical protein
MGVHDRSTRGMPGKGWNVPPRPGATSCATTFSYLAPGLLVVPYGDRTGGGCLPRIRAPVVRGTVIAHVPEGGPALAEHERAALSGFVRRLARLLRYRAAGDGDPWPDGHRYFVPSCTLTWDEATRLGVRGPDDLFGAVVSHRYEGTKAITHPLVSAAAVAPPGWSDAFPEDIRDLVLAGYSAFDLHDALEAGDRLMAAGAVRIKPVLATGGNAQRVVRDRASLESALVELERAGTLPQGVVLEENLAELRTFSIGHIRAAGLEASYFGWQRLTRNHAGRQVFGGSDLTLVPGGFDALLALGPDEAVHTAIVQAARFDEAAQRLLPGLMGTRRNYDVLLGQDATGTRRSAVLEQSWRVGGATGPEIAGLEAFHAEPDRRLVRASCFEVYGNAPQPPPGACVYYDGCDPHVGRLMKYTVVHPNDDTS